MALRGKIGEPEAKFIAEYIDQKVSSTFDKAKDQLATKSDIAEINVTIADFRNSITSSTTISFSDIHNKIADVHTKIADTKADLLKWMIMLFAPFYVATIVFLIKQFAA